MSRNLLASCFCTSSSKKSTDVATSMQFHGSIWLCFYKMLWQHVCRNKKEDGKYLEQRCLEMLAIAYESLSLNERGRACRTLLWLAACLERTWQFSSWLNNMRCSDKDSFLGQNTKQHSLRLVCGYSVIQRNEKVSWILCPRLTGGTHYSYCWRILLKNPCHEILGLQGWHLC